MGNLVTDARLALEDRNATKTIFAVSMSIKYPKSFSSSGVQVG